MLTKQKRNLIYSNILSEMIDDYLDRILIGGFCYYFSDCGYGFNSQNFPEIFKHKDPNSKYIFNKDGQSYWFPVNKEGLWKRIQILKLAIKDTKTINQYGTFN